MKENKVPQVGKDTGQRVQSPERPRDHQRWWFGRGQWLALGTTLMFTVLATFMSWRAVQNAQRERFEKASKQVEDTITTRLNSYINALLQARSFFEASDMDVTRDRFKRYIDGIELESQYPGMLAVGFGLRVSRARLERDQSDIEHYGVYGLKVWPEKSPYDDAIVVAFMEPEVWPNTLALGFDMYSEQVRHESLSAARDSAQPTATPPLTLVRASKDDVLPGFLIFTPVYSPSLVRPPSSGERNKALKGFVYSLFLTQELFSAILAKGSLLPDAIGLEIRDNATSADRVKSEGPLLYRLVKESSGVVHAPAMDRDLENGAFNSEQRIAVAGRTWSIKMTSQKGFVSAFAQWTPFLVAIAGVALSFLLSLALHWDFEHARDLRRLMASEKAARAEAEAQRARLQSLFMQAPAAISVTRGPDHLHELVNPAMRSIFQGDDFTGKLARDVLLERQQLEFLGLINHVYSTGETLEISEFPAEIHEHEQESMLKEASIRYFNAVILPTKDLDGQISGVMTFAVEVTEQVRARNKKEALTLRLETQQRWLESILNLMPTPLMLFETGTGQLVFSNKSAHTLLHESFESKIQLADLSSLFQNPVSLASVSFTDTNQQYNYMEDFFAGKTLVGTEMSLTTPNGTVPVLVSSGIVPADLCHKETSTLAFQDISVLKQTQTHLEQAIRIREEFIATLSHELRTPLGIILGWVEMLQVDFGLEKEVVRILQTIERNARLQLQLVEDLLDVSRVEGGKMSLDIQKVNLVDVVRAAADAIELAATVKGVVIELVGLRGSEAEKAEAPQAFVRGDSARLQQVLWNLLSNAIKFTPAGGRVTVRLFQEQQDFFTCWVLEVCDTGMGIEPNFLPHVFERFRQEDSSTTRRYGGLGLGLSIVRHLAEMHGGTVTAQSAGKGQGARFSVRLPAFSTDQQTPELVSTDHADQASRLDGVRVLVVDDVADVLGVVSRVLQKAGALVQTASSAKEVMDVLAIKDVDVLLCDIGMPEVNGYMLISKIRRHWRSSVRSLPAVALTAYAKEEDKRQALHAGFQLHMSKPVEQAQLIKAVATLVQNDSRFRHNEGGFDEAPAKKNG